MHEATLAARMLQIAEDVAVQQAGQVHRITIVVGELAGVMIDSLTFAFDALKRNTCLAQAVLAIEKQPVCARCQHCGAEYSPKGFPFLCPDCGSNAFQIIKGEEVFVKNMEVEHVSD